MASNINSIGIDEFFPIAGQDNDSQGFRDNFTVIKDNFTKAADEITDLQDNAARKDTDNAFDNNTLSVVNLKAATKEHYNGSADGTTSVPFTTAHHFSLRVDNTATIELSGWPTNDETGYSEYAEVTIQLLSSNAAYGVTFAGATSGNYVDTGSAWTGKTLYMTDDLLSTGTPLASDDSILVKAWTFNGGVDIYFKYEGTYSS